jgi:hypothetical protein
MASVGDSSRVQLESSRSPAEIVDSLQRMTLLWTESAIPYALRVTRITGATVRVRGKSFTLRFTRERRVLAPLVCRGRIIGRSGGSSVEAAIRPSRRWMLVPGAGTLLLAVALMLHATPPGTTLRYALLVGVLWALNVGLVAIPVGSNPAAEHAAYLDLLEGALTDRPTA